MDTLSARIKQKAVELGFHKIGIARAEALKSEGEHFFAWLRRSFHGEMAWLEREPRKRTDPRLIFPEAKSVISVALNYYTLAQHEHDQNDNPQTKWSSPVSPEWNVNVVLEP